MTSHTSESLDKILSVVRTIRKDKGYSLENMAEELAISTSAYDKIEKGKTKLTVARLLQIQKVFDAPLHELLGIELQNYQQINDSSSMGMIMNEQYAQNLYQENQHTKSQLISSLEQHIETLKEEVAYLRGKDEP